MSESRIAPPVRVLVADAGSSFKKSVTSALAEKGHTVSLAASADEAFDRVRAFEPDIILYDLDMKGYEGFEAVTLIAKMRSARRSYIIASSIHKGDDSAGRALEAGAWEFAPKPVPLDFIVEIAQAIKRHLRRPKELPQQSANRSIKVVQRRCPRGKCGAMTAGFILRGAPMVAEEDQFETPLYRKALPGFDVVDYNLLSVSVCPKCYFAFDLAARQWGEQSGAQAQVRAAREGDLFRIAAEADDLLFAENRSPQSALIALRLAIANAQAAAREDSTDDLSALADLLFKAGLVAHTAGDERERDRTFAEAEEVCALIASFEPCAPVYRAAYRLVALYVFFTRDADAARMIKTFEDFTRPAEGRMKPRDSRLLGRYRSAAAGLIAHRNRRRRSTYLSR
ncbi:MAG: response regulator [Planctomycetota bacterium]|jgi:CheY-like chemotaxis protein